MTFTIIRAQENTKNLEFEICNQENEQCTDDGNHQIYCFVKEYPEGFSGGNTKWQAHCANEALLLAKETSVGSSIKSLEKLVGKTI